MITFIFLICLFFLLSCSIEDYPKVIQFQRIVLQEDSIGLECIYKRNYTDKVLEERVTYIGQIIKIINHSVFWGNTLDSPRNEATCFLYNSQNEPIGSYYVGNASSLPCYTEDSSLVFCNPMEEECDAITKISFRDSIPNSIFIFCDDTYGDIFTFSEYENE